MNVSIALEWLMTLILYIIYFFITNKNQAGNWMYRPNLKLRLKVLDSYVLVIRQIGDKWHWGCFLENIYLDKKHYLLPHFFLNHLIQNIIYTNFVSGVENEEEEVWRIHEGPSPHYEFRNDSLFWKLNHKHSHQVRSDLSQNLKRWLWFWAWTKFVTGKIPKSMFINLLL